MKPVLRGMNIIPLFIMLTILAGCSNNTAWDQAYDYNSWNNQHSMEPDDINTIN